PYFWERTKLRRFEHFIFVSQKVKRLTLSLRPEPEKASVIIYNGIDEKMYDFKSSKKGDYILFIGRIEFYQKGIDLLLKAMKKLPYIKLIIAGDGKDRKKLENALKGVD